MSADKRVRPALTDLDQQVEETVRSRMMSDWDQAMTQFFGQLDRLADLHAVADGDILTLLRHLFGDEVADEYEQYLGDDR